MEHYVWSVDEDIVILNLGLDDKVAKISIIKDSLLSCRGNTFNADFPQHLQRWIGQVYHCLFYRVLNQGSQQQVSCSRKDINIYLP